MCFPPLPLSAGDENIWPTGGLSAGAGVSLNEVYVLSSHHDDPAKGVS